MYRGTQRGKVVIYIQATILFGQNNSTMRYKPLKKNRKHPRLKRLAFLLFQRVLQKTLSHAHDNCVAQFLTTLEHSSKKFTVVRSSYLFFIRHSFRVV